MNGYVDCAGLWHKQLSAQEVTDLYNAGNGNEYVERVETTPVALTVSGAAVLSLSQALIRVKSLSATASATPLLQRVTTFARTLAVSASASPIVQKSATFFRTVTATAVASPSVQKAAVFLRSISAAAVALASIIRPLPLRNVILRVRSDPPSGNSKTITPVGRSRIDKATR
jgi:hypothetical protein